MKFSDKKVAHFLLFIPIHLISFLLQRLYGRSGFKQLSSCKTLFLMTL